MPTITIDAKTCEFEQGQTILQVAHKNDVHIPSYCYHDALSIVASCRICLAEVWAPNPRNDNKLEPIPKLVPTCQTHATDGMVVYTDSPKATQGSKTVMEYLLINHPLDCPVCDQAGECLLQDYSYSHGRGISRFEEAKVKQPKKDVGPNILLYSDRCIMCTRCVRFTREITETNELIVDGRGNQEQIDIFPGLALDNELASNVIDLCPVGALLDKDFLFAKRVWDLTVTPSIDGITSSGDNITIEHADDTIYRLKPRTNMDVNKWWITDEVRYGWKFIHSPDRLAAPQRRRDGVLADTQWARALSDLVEASRASSRPLALLVSPTLSCEDAYLLARAALTLDPDTILGVGPVPIDGEDKSFPPDSDASHPNHFVKRAEKCPNARGVRRVLEALSSGKPVHDHESFTKQLAGAGAALITGNYPSQWHTDALASQLGRDDLFVALCDTLASPLVDLADVVLPSCTWAEKAGTFENADNKLQAFEQAIRPSEKSLPEGHIAMHLEHLAQGNTDTHRALFNAANTRAAMADTNPALACFATDVAMPKQPSPVETDMPLVEL
ncbi:MAG: NADH-quinone oxidoreductase subunit G [Planctomycetota bacterium]|jgi:NADH-quinone oxidoreductase subunit G